MGQTQASLLTVVLLSVHLSILVSGRAVDRPEPQPVCNVNKLSAYFWEVYKLYSMQAELQAIDCNKEFNGQLINPAFCECDSVSGKLAEPQEEAETATGFVPTTEGIASGLSPDRQDDLLTTPQSCGFTIIVNLTARGNDEPIAADLAIYKLPPSYTLTRNLYFTVNLTITEHALPVTTTTKTIEKEISEGWQVFRANNLKSALTPTQHEFYVEIEVTEENGHPLSCRDIQTLFILDCSTLMLPSDDVPSDENLMPILTFFTKSQVPWWQLVLGRKKRDITDINSMQLRGDQHQPFSNCQKVPQMIPTQQILGENYEVLSPEMVDIGTCGEHSLKLGGSNTLCSPAELQSAYTLARDKRTNELVQKMLPVVSKCA